MGGARTGGELTAEALIAHGVRTVFCLAGTAHTHLLRALDARGVRIVSCRHEASVVLAADGYARVSGQTGVALIKNDQGLPNALTGICTANAACSPVVVLSSFSPRSSVEAGGDFHETDLAMAEPVAKWVRSVPAAARLGEFVAAAFRQAGHGRPGVALLGFPQEMQGAEVPVVSNRRCDEAGDDTVICAGYESELVDACAGDSGGPLHAATPQGWVQVGIVSGGTLCVDEGERFTTYTRVSAYAEWIRATMAGETEVADLRRFPDYSLPATYADEALPMPLPRDPVTFEVQAGGDLPAADVTPDCAGFVADAPDVRLTFEDPGALLRFTVEAGTDTVLLINGPDGSWSCNDDRSADDLNPELVFSRPQAGQYDIWVGTFADPQELGAYPEAVLAVSGRR